MHSVLAKLDTGEIMHLIIRQRCLRAANYRYGWRSSLLLIVLSALTYGAVVYEIVKVIDEQGEHYGQH